MAAGLALSGFLRWGPRFRRVRSWVIPWGLNLAALAFLGAILAAGTEPGGLGGRWQGWLWFAVPGVVLGLLGCRFPRSVGLPGLVLGAAVAWTTAGALKEFSLLDPSRSWPTAQPLVDRELVTAFSLRVDLISPPAETFRGVPTLVRLRPQGGLPPEWWWPGVAAAGWARSVGAAVPPQVIKYGVYRWTWEGEGAQWRLEKPELTPP